MSYHSQSIIFILTTNLNTKQIFRNISFKFPNCLFKIISSYKEFKKESNVKIIFTEKKFSQSDTICLKEIKAIRKDFPLTIPIILITQEYSFSKLKLFLSNGIESVLYRPINTSLIESILFKYTLKLKDSETFYEYHGIKLYPNLKIAYYNDCKIFLSDIEASILSILIPKEDDIIFYSLDHLKNILREQSHFTVSDTYLRVSISRLRAKFEAVSNLNIIKNRYGRGYYISI